MQPYVIVDVFTGTPLEGNPLAVFTEADGLPPDRMQKVAREMNLSETVFVLSPAAGGDARIRIFTPATELPFAGHPTLGTAFVLCGQRGLDAIELETGAGVIRVEFARRNGLDSPQPSGLPPGPDLPPGPGLPGRMRQPVPTWEPYERAAELLAALGVASSRLPVEAYRNGPRHVYVALDSEEAVSRLCPDITALGALPGIGVGCFAGLGPRWRFRYFAPALGVAEDPATGSAAGPLGVHLARHDEIAFGEQIEVRQGEEIGRPSVLLVRAEGARDQVTAVEVGGAAVIVARGELLA
ncbi:MAG TPA: PhzF family phenazine biosynthesis protein [Streptosporangiaceae bacterium]|jgi:trans-2,3-dihydro-3-hydroxyanthranilate isomerase